MSAARAILAAKPEASYELLLTQRLILQPQIELNVYSKADPARLIGAGFSDIDIGLRLRYVEFESLPLQRGVAVLDQQRRSGSRMSTPHIW